MTLRRALRHAARVFNKRDLNQKHVQGASQIKTTKAEKPVAGYGGDSRRGNKVTDVALG